MHCSKAQKDGGILMWLLILLTLGIGLYLAFGVMKIHKIRGKIDEAMGKKPATATTEDTGLIFAHQEKLNQDADAMQKAVDESQKLQNKAAQMQREVQREVMRAELDARARQ